MIFYETGIDYIDNIAAYLHWLNCNGTANLCLELYKDGLVNYEVLNIIDKEEPACRQGS